MTVSSTPRPSLVVLAALFALVVRVLVPAGFMLAPTAGGAMPQLVICTGAGAIVAPVDARDHHPKKHAPSTVDHQCPFAAAAAALTVPDLAPPVTLPVAATIPRSTTVSVRPGLGLAAPPPPSTGPPSLV